MEPRPPPADLSPFGLALAGGATGVVSGLLVHAFKVALAAGNGLLWVHVPQALHSLGWTPYSAFPLCNYTWLAGAALGALVAGLLQALGPLPLPNLGAWVRELRGAEGCPSAGRWLGSLAFLGLLTGLSGASVGPEPIVIIVPSVLAGEAARRWLALPPPKARALALAGGAGGLAAFFGLPLASAFMVLEVQHVDGAEFAYEALPACVMASLAATVAGNSLWHPVELLGNSRYSYPGGSGGPQPLGAGALLFAPLPGLMGGLTAHLLVACMRLLHRLLHRVKAGHPMKLLLLLGAANGLLAMRFPGAQWWGEEQLQVALTRGCSRGVAPCEPLALPHYFPELAGADAAVAAPGRPLSAGEMLGMAAAKLAMIALCEAGGFVGGVIYPTIFMAGSLGSALGALPVVQAWGGQYIYVSTAAAMSVSLAALLNTHIFAVLLVVVLQANIPHGTISSQVIVLLTAVLLHYILSRRLITARLNLIATQQPRSDLGYLVSTPEGKTAVAGAELATTAGSSLKEALLPSAGAA